jgi:hypothetical protein
MKTLTKFLFCVACISLLFSCQKPDEFNDELSVVVLKSGKTVTVTVPFKADFTGEYKYVLFGEDVGDCDEMFTCRVGVDFTGNATQMGKITGSFDFCACGPNGDYGPTVSQMVAANGDLLYVSCQGFVIEGRLEDHPEYVTSYWRDPFVILGGTGKFEGATGSGMTDDYNSSLDPYSHHHWTGTITLVKGKK